ncbi:hypothetical protein BD311DRAFT_157182 [Dichomitus squalens]|uniref:Uncharacterized protein n=1 Tax=Dichomitus squalens TaxID=114155 RepID=A0A4Q9M995_9APHY|nr:hypothetical protein BD311DRAFT_157182 [Dichomitus squalens]
MLLLLSAYIAPYPVPSLHTAVVTRADQYCSPSRHLQRTYVHLAIGNDVCGDRADKPGDAWVGKRQCLEQPGTDHPPAVFPRFDTGALLPLFRCLRYERLERLMDAAHRLDQVHLNSIGAHDKIGCREPSPLLVQIINFPFLHLPGMSPPFWLYERSVARPSPLVYWLPLGAIGARGPTQRRRPSPGAPMCTIPN